MGKTPQVGQGPPRTVEPMVMKETLRNKKPVSSLFRDPEVQTDYFGGGKKELLLLHNKPGV